MHIKFLALFINSSRSSAVFFISPLLEFWTSFAISFTVSWRNFAYSILAFSFFFRASYFKAFYPRLIRNSREIQKTRDLILNQKTSIFDCVLIKFWARYFGFSVHDKTNVKGEHIHRTSDVKSKGRVETQSKATKKELK